MTFFKDAKLRFPRWWQWVVAALGLLLAVDFLVYLTCEGLWFTDVNYLKVFQTRILTQMALGLTAFLLSLLFTFVNLGQAFRTPPAPVPPESVLRTQHGVGLKWLLPSALVLGALVGLQLVYQGEIAVSYWRGNFSLYNPSPPVPLWSEPDAVRALIQLLLTRPWQLMVLAGAAIALMLYPRWLSWVAALLMSLGFGLILSELWSKVLLAVNPVPFGQIDPIFQKDIGFYIFRLPLWEMLEFWLLGLFLFVLVAILLIYLLSGNTLSRGRFYGFSPDQQRHLYALVGGLFFVTALSHWLSRYQILYTQEGVVFGAGYTNIHVNLPVNTGLSILSMILGLGFWCRFWLWPLTLPGLLARLRFPQVAGTIPGKTVGLATRPLRSRPLLWGIAFYLTLLTVGGLLAPPLVQRLIVQPNELARERPYIVNSIALTRDAFDLSDINSEPFDPSGSLTVADLEENELTLENIRLWDTRPLLESNRQLQQIRLYYEFLDADVDRYNILNESGGSDRRQVLVSARELNYERVPDIAKTWVNEHFVYTHGFGFTMSPVNTASADGLPAYFVRGIDHVPSSEAVRQSIPIGKPRIYFGELTDSYLMVNTEVPELDYPSGEDNIYTTYQGRSGVNIGPYWRRLLFARHLQDWQMLFTEDFTPATRTLFRRDITERVQAIAPFLRFDTDPYLVVADIGDASSRWGTDPNRQMTTDYIPDLEVLQERNTDLSADNFSLQTDENYLYWIIDAYTVSDRYPYSDPNGNDFNYIRNSVKVVVDAYHGSVAFYVADPEDPIIQTWNRIFPNMFLALDAMPNTLRAHIRYPQDLFQVQADQLMTYHMTEPQVFYNREDQWRAPNEIYASEAQPVEPYYLIMRLPTEETEEFILLRLFTPSQRNNLIAWLAARSDGERYGLKLLYRFPKQELVFGPEQIEARINQDPLISQRISLWNTQGSRAQQGNLLAIPIEQSLIYVEPLYLVAEQNQLPALTRVIAVYKNRIAMGETLEDTIAAIVTRERPSTPPILRELDDESIPGSLLPDVPSPSQTGEPPQGNPPAPPDAIPFEDS